MLFTQSWPTLSVDHVKSNEDDDKDFKICTIWLYAERLSNMEILDFSYSRTAGQSHEYTASIKGAKNVQIHRSR